MPAKGDRKLRKLNGTVDQRTNKSKSNVAKGRAKILEYIAAGKAVMNKQDEDSEDSIIEVDVSDSDTEPVGVKKALKTLIKTTNETPNPLSGPELEQKEPSATAVQLDYKSKFEQLEKSMIDKSVHYQRPARLSDEELLLQVLRGNIINK